MILDPASFDRRIRRAALALRDAVRAAHADPVRGAANPLEAHRTVSTRTAYRELAELPDAPDLAAFRRWAYVLTIERVTWPDRVRFEAAFAERSIVTEQPERVTLSAREIIARVLGEPSDGRRRAWAEALERGAGRVADQARLLAERRAEADALLRGSRESEDIETIAAPCATRDALPRLARALVDRLPPIEPPPRTWDEAVSAALARGAVEGWPARLGVRWLAELFRGTGLLEGLALDVPRLPRPLGATSFARALGAFGAALADADGSETAPFALAHPPFDVRRERRAALFAGLVADPVFFARALHVGTLRARDQARDVVRALTVTLRFDALRVLLRGALAAPARAQRDAFDQEADRALGSVVPPSLALVVPRLDWNDSARFAGALLAARDRRRLIEQFDEDWFRNPRAARAIREEDALVPDARVADAELEAGLAEVVALAATA